MSQNLQLNAVMHEFVMTSIRSGWYYIGRKSVIEYFLVGFPMIRLYRVGEIFKAYSIGIIMPYREEMVQLRDRDGLP